MNSNGSMVNLFQFQTDSVHTQKDLLRQNFRNLWNTFKLNQGLLVVSIFSTENIIQTRIPLMILVLFKKKKKIMSPKGATLISPYTASPEQGDILEKLSSQEMKIKESNFYQKYSL